MMIEPKATLKGIGQIADHVFLRDRDLRFVNGEGAGEEDPPNLQGPCTEGGAYDSIKIIVGDDLFVSQRFNPLFRTYGPHLFDSRILSCFIPFDKSNEID